MSVHSWSLCCAGTMTVSLALSFFFLYSILRWSVAVSTMRRQSSRIAAFLRADAMPMFCWPRSASTARSHVWLGLPSGRFQSGGSPGSPQRQHGGGPLVVSCGQYVQRAANVCQWPGGREDGIRWLLWLPHSSHGEWRRSIEGTEMQVTSRFGAHGEEGRGILWRPPAYSLLPLVTRAVLNGRIVLCGHIWLLVPSVWPNKSTDMSRSKNWTENKKHMLVASLCHEMSCLHF